MSREWRVGEVRFLGLPARWAVVAALGVALVAVGGGWLLSATGVVGLVGGVFVGPVIASALWWATYWGVVAALAGWPRDEPPEDDGP